jgi:hypothetical protein
MANIIEACIGVSPIVNPIGWVGDEMFLIFEVMSAKKTKQNKTKKNCLKYKRANGHEMFLVTNNCISEKKKNLPKLTSTLRP